MNKLGMIKRDVRSLSLDELEAFRAWFLEFDAGVWDRQIEEDARAGTLDALTAKALVAYRAGEATHL